MSDYSFFAMLFAVVQTLAPSGATQLELQNVRHPEQTIVWDRGDDGRWALAVNGRDVGTFVREGSVVTHFRPPRDPSRHALSDLLDPSTLQRRARRIDLRGTFAPARIEISREGGAVTLRDPTRHLLVTDLRLRHH